MPLSVIRETRMVSGFFFDLIFLITYQMKTMITAIVTLTVCLLLPGFTAFSRNILATPAAGNTTFPKIKFLSVKSPFQKTIVSRKAGEDLPAVYYGVERSEGSLYFKITGMVLVPKPANAKQFCFENGDKLFKRKTKIYYRVKQVNAAGEVYYTGIIKSADQEK
jgi:hypothetical protein